MTHFGYQVNLAQSDPSKRGFLLKLTLIPGVLSAACAVSMLMDQITKQMNCRIADDLAQRRAAV